MILKKLLDWMRKPIKDHLPGKPNLDKTTTNLIQKFKGQGPTKEQQIRWAKWTRREKIAKKSRKINYARCH